MIPELLISALIIVESGGNDSAVGDGGRAKGCLQIHVGVIEDVRKFSGVVFTHESMHLRSHAIYACQIYLTHYGNAYERRTGKKASLEVLARIWNGGYAGLWRNEKATDDYWRKVKVELEK